MTTMVETANSLAARAEELKSLANEAFKVNKFSQAIDLYTQAIELNSQNAVYWANRAFAHTKLEEYGSAIQDATTSIEIDPKYSKGYYRRGAAYLAMGKFKEALKDFQQVKKICPNDPDAAKKLKECEKAFQKIRFELIYASTQKLFQHGASMPPPPPIWSNQQHDTYATPPPPWFGGYRNETHSYGPSSYNNSHIGNNGDTVDEFSLRILCPAGKIGGVIGKAGANIRQLERDTLARIQVEDTHPDAEERIINVTSREGPWDQISPTIEAILQLQIRTSAASEDGTITTRLLAPSSKVGCLLGQGGNIITEMRRRTRADIRVSSKEDKPNYTSANEELVQISGNHDVAREALLEILSRLRARTFRSGSASVNNAHVIPDRVFTPPEIMSGRGMPSSHRIGAAENPAHVYPGHGFAPHENISSSGPLSSSIGRAGNTFGYEYPKRPEPLYVPEPLYAAHGYPPVPPPAAAGYSNMTSTMEIQIPSSAMHSVLGMGGSNISNIQQISGAWVKVRDPHPGSSECVVEIHGTSEQLKMAQSLLQSYVSSGGQNATQSLAPSAAHAPLYRQY